MTEATYAPLVTSTVVPLALVIIVGAIGLWVYLDAKRCADEGAPVAFRIGGFVIATPVAWLLACVVVWIVFFPMYVVSRSR